MHRKFAEDCHRLKNCCTVKLRERLELRFSAMPQDASARFVEAERAELERVVRALARWPRLSHLLAYMGAKLSSGDADQLNEYNIASEVLSLQDGLQRCGGRDCEGRDPLPSKTPGRVLRERR